MTTFIHEVNTEGSRDSALREFVESLPEDAQILEIRSLPPTPYFTTRFHVTVDLPDERAD